MKNQVMKSIPSRNSRLERRKLSELKPHPQQAEMFDDLSEHELRSLAEDIEKHGLREPIEILPDGTIISGHQRWRALQMIGRAVVDVVVRHDLFGNDAAVEAEFLKQNLLRRQLHPLDKIKVAIRLREMEHSRPRGSYLSEEGEDARDRVGKVIGVSGRTLSRYVRVLRTPIEVQRAFREGKLSLVLAGKIAGLPKRDQEEIARRIRRGMEPTAVVAKFVTKQRSRHIKPRDALACFIKGLGRGVADLDGRTGNLTVDAVAQHRKTLRRGRKLIGKLLRRLQQDPIQSAV